MAEQGSGAAEFALGVVALHGVFLEPPEVEAACRHFGAALAKGYAGAKFRAVAVPGKGRSRARRGAAARGGRQRPPGGGRVGRPRLPRSQAASTRACAWDRLTLAAAAGRPSAQSVLAWMYAQGVEGKAGPRPRRDAVPAGSARRATPRRRTTSANSTKPAAVRRATRSWRSTGTARRPKRGSPRPSSTWAALCGGNGGAEGLRRGPQVAGAGRTWRHGAARQLLDWMEKEMPGQNELSGCRTNFSVERQAALRVVRQSLFVPQAISLEYRVTWCKTRTNGSLIAPPWRYGRFSQASALLRYSRRGRHLRRWVFQAGAAEPLGRRQLSGRPAECLSRASISHRATTTTCSGRKQQDIVGFTVVSPYVRAEAKSGAHKLRAARCASTTAAIWNSSKDNYTDYSCIGNGDLVFDGRTGLKLRAEFRHGHDPRGSTDRAFTSTPDEYNNYGLDGVFRYGAPGRAGPHRNRRRRLRSAATPTITSPPTFPTAIPGWRAALSSGASCRARKSSSRPGTPTSTIRTTPRPGRRSPLERIPTTSA